MRYLRNLSAGIVFVATLIVANGQGAGQDVTHIQTLTDKSLKSVVAITGTSDGEYLYAVGYSPGNLVCIRRNPKSGKIKRFQSIDKELDGAIGIDISPDQEWVVVCCYSKKRVVVYRRDKDNGKLTETHRLHDSDPGVEGLDVPVSPVISPDSRFVYVSNGSGSLTVLQLDKDGKLEFLQKHTGLKDKINGGRMMATNPERTHFFLPCKDSNSVAVFDRDPEAGHVRILSIREDGADGISQLSGAIGAACAPDARHIYVSSGRFKGGANSISSFELVDETNLTLVQELKHQRDIEFLDGPNSVLVSPDGKEVWVTTARSVGAMVFDRDSETGKLDLKQNLRVKGSRDLGLCAGIWISNDNQHAYICGEHRKSIYVFKRSVDDEQSDD